jgi:hypothetical protein
VSSTNLTRTPIFAERRQALGWLTLYGSSRLLVVVVTLPTVLRGGAPAEPVSSAISVLLALLLLGLIVLAYRMSRGVHERLRAHLGEMRWWRREHLGAELAAQRLGWPPAPVVWVGRGLLLLIVVLPFALAQLTFTAWRAG